MSAVLADSTSADRTQLTSTVRASAGETARSRSVRRRRSPITRAVVSVQAQNMPPTPPDSSGTEL